MGARSSKEKEDKEVDWEVVNFKRPRKALPGPTDELAAEITALYLQNGEDEESYHRARLGFLKPMNPTWNHDARGFPLGVAVCSNPDEVSAAVRYANEHCRPNNVPLAIAAGRHSSLCMPDGAFVVDIAAIDSVVVDADAKTADVGGGALQRNVDAACEPHGLAVTAGHVGSTGCGGLIQQGGHGFLEKLTGLAVDALVEVDVVLADGTMVTASDAQHQDLFWALRGAGANFGIITRYKMRLTSIPKVIFGGERVHVPLGLGKLEDRPALVRAFFTEMTRPDDDATTGILVLPVGGPVVEMMCHFGPVDAGRARFEEHRRTVGYPVSDKMREISYWNDAQKFAPDARGSFYMSAVAIGSADTVKCDDFCKAVSSVAERRAGPGSGTSCSIIIIPTNGKVSERANPDTAFAMRHCSFWVFMQAEWTRPDKRDVAVEWVQRVKEALAPFSEGAYGTFSEANTSVYKNTGTVGGGVRNVFGDNLPRLRKIKKKYDPENLFAANDNVTPAEEE